MVIALRKLTVLSVKPMSAQIVLTGGAHAVPSPVAVHQPETFMRLGRQMLVLPVPDENVRTETAKAKCRNSDWDAGTSSALRQRLPSWF